MDNLKDLQDQIESQIDPNGAPGSILAENHKNRLIDVMSKSGKYVGSPYLANKELNVFPIGTMSFESNPLNNINEHQLIFAKKNLDLNDFGLYLNTLILGDFIKFKDFVGRSVFYEYQSHVAGKDQVDGDVYIVSVKGLADNPGYTYQDTENPIAVFSVLKAKSVGPTLLSNFTDDIGATEIEVVKVTNKSQIINQILDETKKYLILKNIVLVDGEFINMDSSPLIEGLGADYTNITTTSTTGVIFKSVSCGNINIKNISLSAVGVTSKVFELKDLDADFGVTVGSHEFRLVGVNFTGCQSLGFVDGFRQWFTKDLGFYGCSDGIEMRGVWNGIFFEQSNLFGFSNTGTLFKQGANLSFVDRCIFQLNLNVPSGAVFLDFLPSVFQDDEALQLNNFVAKVDGVKNQDNATLLIPNISANDQKSLWGLNSGLPSTAREKIIIENSVSGTYNINWLNDTYDLTLTGDTTFTESNLPANGVRTKTINITLTGDFQVIFPANWENFKVGTFKGSDLNDISIKFIWAGKYFMKISNSLSVYPAPFLYSITPAGVLPTTQTLIVFKGEFYTPATIVQIEGQVVNSVSFVDTQTLNVVVNSGSVEGDYNVTISNGQTVVFNDRLTISNGTVIVPNGTDFITSGAVSVVDNNVSSTSSVSVGYATWNTQVLAVGDEFTLQFKPITSSFFNGTNSFTDLDIIDATTSSRIGFLRITQAVNGTFGNKITFYIGSSATINSDAMFYDSDIFGFRRTVDKIQMVVNGVVKNERALAGFADFKFKFNTNAKVDYQNIKLIRQ